MSKVVKAVKKVAKGVGKVVKKVVKGVVKLGKSIVKGVGKFMGKLGPIGTIAIGFIAPYAIGAMASSSIGWVSALGKGAQAITSAVTAPFKMAGQALGKGISTVGNQFGGAFKTITDKVASAVGYQGGTLGENFTRTIDGVKGAFNDGFGTSYTNQAGEVLGEAAKAKPLDLGTVEAGPGSGPVDAQQGIDMSRFDTSNLQIDNTQQANIFGDMGPKQVFDSTQADPFMTYEEAANINLGKPVPDAQYNLEPEGDSMLKKGLSAAKSLLGKPAAPASMTPLSPITDSGSFVAGMEAAGDGSTGPGGLGESFYAQDQTGLMQTEEFARRSASLLGRRV